MKELICITCPTGCRLQAELDGDGVRVAGNACRRGEAFALAELTHPMRNLTSTVRTVFPEAPMLPVRTDREIPKSAIPAVMTLLAGLVLKKPAACGDVIAGLEPICAGNIIVTADWAAAVR
ncbi:MAG: DUF1667 domain-containing protein [Oscillospiraceae bacterium]|jgi:CxxC motif-containing protein|nr:DUF1667 domain-containing protein [Oscillospiraceae bacterium]